MLNNVKFTFWVLQFIFLLRVLGFILGVVRLLSWRLVFKLVRAGLALKDSLTILLRYFPSGVSTINASNI